MAGFPKDRRLLLSSDFNRVFEGGIKYLAPRVVCLAMLNDKSENSQGRLGLVVSKKVGNAVVRNRVKRRLREIYRLQDPHLTQGIDFVVIARNLASRSEYLELQKDFSFVLERLSAKLRRPLKPLNSQQSSGKSLVDPSH